MEANPEIVWKVSLDGKIRVCSNPLLIQVKKEDLKWVDMSFCLEKKAVVTVEKQRSELEEESKIDPLEVLKHEFCELVENEERFVSGIRNLHSDLSQPLKLNLKEVQTNVQTFNKIFGQVKLILSVNEKFLEKMKLGFSIPDYPRAILSLFSKFEEFQFYLVYSQNYEDSIACLREELEKNVLLKEFVKKCGFSFTKIENVMISPVQRFPRYSLVLQRIKKKIAKLNLYGNEKEIHTMLDSSIQLLHDTYSRMNIKKKEKREMKIMLGISKLFKEVCGFTLASPGRKFIAQFEGLKCLIGKTTDGKQVKSANIYFFSDSLYILLDLEFYTSLSFDSNKSTKRVLIPIVFGGNNAYRVAAYFHRDRLRLKCYVVEQNSEIKFSNLWNSISSWRDLGNIENVKRGVSSIVESKSVLTGIVDCTLRVKIDEMKKVFESMKMAKRDESLQIIFDEKEEEKMRHLLTLLKLNGK